MSFVTGMANLHLTLKWTFFFNFNACWAVARWLSHRIWASSSTTLSSPVSSLFSSYSIWCWWTFKKKGYSTCFPKISSSWSSDWNWIQNPQKCAGFPQGGLPHQNYTLSVLQCYMQWLCLSHWIKRVAMLAPVFQLLLPAKLIGRGTGAEQSFCHWAPWVAG